MHVVQSMVLLSYTVHLSVRLSVPPPVTVICGHIGWVSMKVIMQIISADLCSLEPQHRRSSPSRIHSEFRWNRGGVAVLSRKPAIAQV